MFSKNILNRHNIDYGPNLYGERLLAANGDEMQVVGQIDIVGTYCGISAIMDCLVTPDLSDQIIVSKADAEKVTAVTIDRRDIECNHQSSPPPTKKAKHTDTQPKPELGQKRKLQIVSDDQPPIKTKRREKDDKKSSIPAPDKETNQGAPKAATQRVDHSAPKKAAASHVVHSEDVKAAASHAELSVPDRVAAQHDEHSAPAKKEEPTSSQIVPTVPPPKIPFEEAQKSDQYAYVLCPLSATKVQKKIDEWFAKYPNLSDKLLPKPMVGPPMKIQLTKDVPDRPKQAHTAVVVPLHYKEASNELIRSLLKDKVIRKVSNSTVTQFCSRSFVVPKPNGKGVRLVIDFSETNKYIQRPTHPFPAASELLQSIPPDSEYFCVCDATWGYYQILVHPASRHITTFIHELGRFEYLRAPMGLCASGDEWCRRSDDAVAGLPGVLKLVDDILIHGRTLEELFERIENVLEACNKHNIALSRKKFKIGKEAIFAGFHISKGGIRPTEARIEAIKLFPVPKDLRRLRGFIGLCNHLAKFIPDGAQITDPLRELTEKSKAFVWTPAQEEAFVSIKNALAHKLTLHHFDPKLSTFLVTDASRIGFGFLLYQEKTNDRGSTCKRLVQCGSRSVNGPESRYAVCELEGLAVKWAITKCRYFLLGMQHFDVLTDHKTLKGVFEKCLSQVENVRLRRYREDLQGYNFTVSHVSGAQNIGADLLSRNPVWPAEPEDPNDHAVCKAISDAQRNEDPTLTPLLEAASTDKEYQDLLQAILSDVKCKHLDPEHIAHKYSAEWKNLSVSVQNLVVLNNERIVIPATYRAELLELLHTAHCGIEKSKWKANQLYWWPGFAKDIEKRVKRCTECRRLLPSQPHQPIVQRNKATYPMEVLGSDLYELYGKHYLVVVDQYSGFPLVAKLFQLSTAATIAHLENWFNMFGECRVLISDNGPQYDSREFQKYAKERHFVHLPTDPLRPSGNGLSESAVKNVKLLLQKYHADWKKFSRALLAWRNMINDSGSSPAIMFLGHEQRTCLPMLPGQYEFQLDSAVEAAQKRKDIRAKQYASRGGKTLPPLQVGKFVLIKSAKGWVTRARVTEVCVPGRSYIVETGSGKKLRRNREMLRPAYEELDDADSDTMPDTVQEDEPDSIQESEDSRQTADAPTRRSTRTPVPRQLCSCCKLIKCPCNFIKCLKL